MKVKTIIFTVFTLLWCGVIFMFSAENSDESSDTSGRFIAAVCDFIVPEFDSFTGAEREEFVENLQFYVRKMAHFTAYAILGFLVYQTADFTKKKKFKILAAVGFSAFYACTDEFHQSMVPGRTPQVRDVLIDTSGAILGAVISMLVTMLILHICLRRRETKENKETDNV